MCNALLPAPNGTFFSLGVTAQGLLTTTLVTTQDPFIAGPTLVDGTNVFWQLTANNAGDIVSTKKASAPFALQYLSLHSGQAYWKLTTRADGLLVTNAITGVLGDFIPYPVDVTMSAWPENIGVICPKCGNASIHVSADLSNWCCECNMFINPEDTNVVVILDE